VNLDYGGGESLTFGVTDLNFDEFIKLLNGIGEVGNIVASL
jgi:hypothetical protein